MSPPPVTPPLVRPAAGHPGDRPGIPLEAGPIGFLHALVAGAAVPTPTAVDGEAPLLEEEPALWPTPDGRPT